LCWSSPVTVTKSIIFWDVTPCSLLSYNRRFGGTYCLHPQGRRNNFSKNQQSLICLPPAYLLVLTEIISSTLKMKAICSSETSVASQQITRRHIPEDDALHNHRCENLKCCCDACKWRPVVVETSLIHQWLI
jgi:hypothetical protein